MSTRPGFGFDEDARAVAEAVSRFCEQRGVDAVARQPEGPFPRTLWVELAALGVFAAAAPGMSDAGGARTVCATCEALGEHIFPGPVADTYLAIQVVHAAEAAALIEGRSLVSVSRSGSKLLPWGMEADVYLAVIDAGVAPIAPTGEATPVSTLGGETWARAERQVGEPLPDSDRALALGNLALAAYLAAAALQLVRETSAHAATRKQFGRALGDFQAVAHPLADCAIGATAARQLARAAAGAWDAAWGQAPTGAQQQDQQADDMALELAAGAAVSARRASLHAAHVCHQVYGGIGVTLEGPAFHITRRIRQLASQAGHGNREANLLLAGAGLGER